jgi:hypothetical protein
LNRNDCMTNQAHGGGSGDSGGIFTILIARPVNDKDEGSLMSGIKLH